MKRNPSNSVFLNLISSLLFFLLFNCCGNSPGFVIDTKNEYVFKNEKSQLIIDKGKWGIKLLGEDGQVRFSEASSPTFLINGEWVSVLRPGKIISRTGSPVQIVLFLSSGQKALA